MGMKRVIVILTELNKAAHKNAFSAVRTSPVNQNKAKVTIRMNLGKENETYCPTSIDEVMPPIMQPVCSYVNIYTYMV